MAAYGALVSLSHTLHQILHPPPLNNIIIDREQIEFLHRKVNISIAFLETYSGRHSEEIINLETQIADAAYAAEDIIESNVEKQIRATGGENISTLLCEGIQTVVEKFFSIEKESMKIQDKKSKATTATSSKVPLPSGKATMVGFDKHLIQMMSELTTDESNRQIIPIVGMGGIGKTTLATAVYNNPFIVEHFHVRAWVTVSQEYSVRELLFCLLSQFNKSGSNKHELTDDEIGELLHKELFDRKYLIVMDDMWDIQAWEKVKRFLPCNDNGSRILVTTRLSNLAVYFESCNPYKMDFLNDGQSWDLLREKVFAEEDCPVELEEIGKCIAKRCSGLPLALVVIGGLLATSKKIREHWEYVAGDVTSALNFENDEHLMKILSLSYIQLPVYLKPCFLYLAVFPEDFEIHVTMLVRLWVAEGLIKTTQPAECLEEVADEYLEDLIHRNLIMVHKRRSNGKVKLCKIHDLVRDLCIMQAEKEKLVCIARLNPNVEIEKHPRIYSPCKPINIKTTEGLRLPKVVHVDEDVFDIEILMLSNLRYVFVRSVSSIPPMSLCWNLQTLIVSYGINIALPAEIWQMSQLRHLIIRGGMTLPDPPDDQNVIVLENLQTLKTIEKFKCTEQVLKRIPNLKRLRTQYGIRNSDASQHVEDYYLTNLVCFKKLESLNISGGVELRTGIAVPISLKKLTLSHCMIPWEDLSVVGKLPNLEVLKLNSDANYRKGEWNPNEGEFCRLKFLSIRFSTLGIWRAEDYHFPCLEHLSLFAVALDKIPRSFAEILQLQVIELYDVKESMRISAWKISKKRKLLGYEPLQIRRGSHKIKILS